MYSNPLDYFGLPLILFTIFGTYFFGDFGLVFGVIIGGGIGLLAWSKRHRHVWERRMLYDERGEPQLMLKFCRCGEIIFDGLVSTEK